jgi:4-phospho-D-threonate 3-dehydrogenase / 4-phospho-D-erythronate 3-dehydrogenase
MVHATRPRLAVTLGDPAGVGPELVLRLIGDQNLAKQCQLVVYGSFMLAMRVARAARISFSPTELASGALPHGHAWVDVPFAEAMTLLEGHVQEACGRHALACIEQAVRAVLEKKADALVTAPINKEAMHLAGVPFPGHTELLAHLTKSPLEPCMAFVASVDDVNPPFPMVSLVTIHESLARVSALLTPERIERVIRLTHDACRSRGMVAPRIGVLAFNPHAGEGGLFGDEEQRVIQPAIERVRQEGMDVSGPLVPDTAFLTPFDAVVAMYHDQGLIPFKMAAFDSGVNVTLGLPIIRTSPDHGTAFDIAWQGIAKPESFRNAVKLAVQMVVTRREE